MADQAEDSVVLAQQRTGADYALHSDTQRIIYWCHARFKMHCHSGRWHCAVTFKKKSCGAQGKKVLSLLAPHHEFNHSSSVLFLSSLYLVFETFFFPTLTTVLQSTCNHYFQSLFITDTLYIWVTIKILSLRLNQLHVKYYMHCPHVKYIMHCPHRLGQNKHSSHLYSSLYASQLNIWSIVYFHSI